MGIPFWETQPSVYDAITIGGVTFRGLPVHIKGATSIKIDAKAGPGTDGARLTYQGQEAAKVAITLELYTEEHLRALEDLITIIQPKPGKTEPSPVAIVHPLLELARLKDFYIKTLPIPERKAPGIYDVKLDCVQYFPFVHASGGGKKKGNTKKQPSVFDPSERLVNRIGRAAQRAADKEDQRPSKTNTGPSNTYGGRRRGFSE